MNALEYEISRLERIYDQLGYALNRQSPASSEVLASVFANTGISLPDELLELWRYSNGSNRQFWFVLGDIEEEDCGVPLMFETVEQSLNDWRQFSPYDERVYRDWYDDESWGERDPRIQRHLLRHKKWFPFAELNGGMYHLQVDNDPTPQGKLGQIIYYVHDPDGVFWEAPDFITFFQKSNSVLEHWAKNDKRSLIESFQLDW